MEWVENLLLNGHTSKLGCQCLNPTAPARCKAVGQPFQADAVYLACTKPGGLGQPGKADVHTLRCRINRTVHRREQLQFRQFIPDFRTWPEVETPLATHVNSIHKSDSVRQV